MAHIFEYLKQQVHKSRAEKEIRDRESGSDYQMINDRFKLPLGLLREKGGDMQQFCGLYSQRLESLRQAVKDAAELKWKSNSIKAQYVQNLLDMQPEKLTIIIGTLFKEQKNKPSVFDNLTGVINSVNFYSCSLGDEKMRGQFTGDDDYAVLEDGSGRIQIKDTLSFKCNEHVTGTIIALLGRADTNGFFLCQDYCYAGVPYKAELPTNVNTGIERGLFDQLENRKFVALTSGLNFGLEQPQAQKEAQQMALFMLSKFFQGSHPNERWNDLASKISRVIICGDSVREHDLVNEVQRSSFRTQETNKTVYKDLNDVYGYFEKWVKSFVDSVDTDVMPGSQDFSNSYMPQQPVNSFLFPGLNKTETINFVTNPHNFTMAGLEFIGTSGQNIHDMAIFARLRSSEPIDCLKMLLEIRHICPTAPDTLRSFPFRTGDPFVISDQAPDVFFAGCQPKYQEEIIYQHKKSKESAIKLLSIPTFIKTKSIVLLDLQSLQSYELHFGQAEQASEQMVE